MTIAALIPRDRRWQLAVGWQAVAGQAAWQGIRLMIAYGALEATGSPVFVGVVAAVFALAGLVVSMPAGRLVDRFGSAVVNSGGLVICLVGVVIGLCVPTVLGILITAAFVGCGHIGAIVGQQGLVARLAARSSPDAAFGTLTAAASIGQLVGPPLVTAIAMLWSSGQTHPDTRAGLVTCTVLLALALPPFFVLRRAERRLTPPKSTRRARIPLRTVLTVPGVLRSMLVGAAVLVTVDLLSSFIPVWATAQAIPATVVGWLLALRALVTISSRFGLARLVSRYGRKILLLIALALAVVALIALPFADAWWAIPVMVLLGLGVGLPQPLTLAWMSLLAPAAAHGAVFGARMTVNRLAQVTIPLAVAAVAGPLGVVAVFWSTATILLGSMAVVAFTRSAVLDDRGSPDDVDRDAGTPDPG